MTVPLSVPSDPGRKKGRSVGSSEHALDGGVPASLSSLIDRHDQLETMAQLVLDPRVRLVTLIGPPGVGKTRLALEGADRMSSQFPDGVCFVPLASVDRGCRLLSAIALAMGVRQTAGRSVHDVLVRALRDRRALLVLDNLEQLSGAALVIARLLASCRGLTVLATSRARLRVSGERLLPVEPLDLPRLSPLPPCEELGRVPSVRLLVERATAVAPEFRLTPTNAALVARLCVELDGLPLAIELAAARCRVLESHELLDRMDEKLRLLTDGPRDAPPRQRTLRAAINWSYDLLTPTLQRLFRQLAAFAGGCTLEAAEAVALCTDNPVVDVLDGVTSLIDHSLLRKERVPGGELRVSMLETIREFALEQLAASGELDAVRRRHAAYFANLAERAASPRLDGPQGPALLARLEREHGNLRAALGWLANQGDAEPSLRMAGALWSFWELHGHAPEGLGWLEAAIADDAEASSDVRARALIGAAVLHREQGDYAAAEAPARESVALRRALGDEAGLAESLLILSNITAATNSAHQATALATECLEIRRRRGDTVGTTWAMVVLGHVLMFHGDFQSARSHFEAAMVLRSGNLDNLVDGWLLRGLGAICAGANDFATARTLLERGLEVFRAHGSAAGVGSSLLVLGDLALRFGDPTTGHASLEEAEAELARGGGIGWHTVALLRLGRAPLARLVDEFGTVPIVAGWRVALGRDVPSTIAPEAAAAHGRKRPLAGHAHPTAHEALTRREREVLALVARHYTNREIADELVLSTRTVERHLANIFGKLGVSTRRQASAYGREHGLLPAEDRAGQSETYAVPPVRMGGFHAGGGSGVGIASH